MSYVEAFVAPVPSENRDAYLATARTMAGLFKEYGALSVTECWEANVPEGKTTSFPLAVQRQPGESIVFGWMVWPSRAARDAAFEKMNDDPRMAEAFTTMPFDGKRMIFGGFEPMLEM